MDVLVTYDIADTETGGGGASRLRRVADLCEKYGQRVQFSVFECRLSKARLAQLIGDMEDIIDHARDSVHVYHFSGGIEAAKRCLGRREEHVLGEPWVL